MKPLNIVTVLRMDQAIAPGIVLSVTEREGGGRPSLNVITAMEGGDAGIVAAPLRDLPHADDDKNGTYRWREYDAGDFEPVAEPAAASTGDGGGQAENTNPPA